MSSTRRRLPRRPSFFYHLHPPTIPAPQARFRYTLGAGGVSVFLVLVTVITGALEMFFYVPIPQEAALSIQKLNYLVPYGGLVRNLHYWSAQGLVGVASLHLLRVIFTGAYTAPRRFNYLLGLSLLVLILLLDFTGYVLRWDESVRWALVAGTNLLASIPWAGPAIYRLAIGGSLPGAATLLRFYAWHVFGLTLALLGLISWHIFRLRRDGGIAAPPATSRPTPLDGSSSSDAHATPERITRFELVRRETTAALVALAMLILAAALLPVPIAAPMAESGTLGGDPRAPWFFLWVQQLLKWGDPFLMGVLIPLALLALLAALPYLLPAPRPTELGRWFPRRSRLAQVLAAIIVMLMISLTTFSLLEAQRTPNLAPGSSTNTPASVQSTSPDSGPSQEQRGPSSGP